MTATNDDGTAPGSTTSGSTPSGAGDRDRLETVAPRLIERWLDEAESHANGPEGGPEARGAAAQARRAWEDGGRFTADAARELADWASARVTETAFNEDRPGGGTPRGLTVAEKEAVHHWLAEQSYLV